MLRDDREAEQFARLWADYENRTPNNGPPLLVHPRTLNGAGVLVRPGTTDPQVLDDTFVGLYHLPPAALAPEAIILDLGGNVGYTAAHYAAICPQARVICVEMDAGNAALARENLRSFGDRCTVIHAAAWSADGELTYGGTEEWGFRVSGLEGQTTTPSGTITRRVRALRIETILRECNVDHVDFAKIDIEGAEANIIRADASWLKKTHTIMLEYHEPATHEGMADALRASGFAVRDDAKHPRCIVGMRSAATSSVPRSSW